MAKPRTRNDNTIPKEKSVLKVLLELVYLIILLVPNIFRAIVKKFWPPKAKSLDGLVVLVTGAGGGLGQELALGFAHHGAAVACVDADQGAALATAEEIIRDGEKARAYHTDVSRSEQIAELGVAVAKELGLVDILVINTAALHCQEAEDCCDAAAGAVLDATLLSHVRMVREFLPRMKQRGVGHVVSVASMAGHSALAGAALYSGVSWAVNGFMESVRLDLLLAGYEHIRFSLVSAAVMDAPLTKNYSVNALQRLGTRRPEQVAAAVIAGVRRNQVYINVPGQIYFMCALAKLLPTPVVDRALRLLSPRPKHTTKTS